MESRLGEDDGRTFGLDGKEVKGVNKFIRQKHHAKHHNLGQKVNKMKSRDEYDGDTNTVSPYDAMEKH